MFNNILFMYFYIQDDIISNVGVKVIYTEHQHIITFTFLGLKVIIIFF